MKKKHSENKLVIISSKSPFAYTESYKTLRTNLNFVSLNNEYKKLVITSAIPGEGKSSIAVNLAVSLAENGSRVLLMDCDLRRPMLHRHLWVDQVLTIGVSSVLGSNFKVEESIYHYEVLNIDLMLAGAIPPNPTELLGSSRMKDLLEHLGKTYDYVICDTPPISLVTDAAVLSRYCDGALLVIKQNYATFEQVKTAQKNMETAGAKIIGTVLNQYNVEKDIKESRENYYYYNYGYGYRNHAKAKN